MLERRGRVLGIGGSHPVPPLDIWAPSGPLEESAPPGREPPRSLRLLLDSRLRRGREAANCNEEGDMKKRIVTIVVAAFALLAVAGSAAVALPTWASGSGVLVRHDDGYTS